MAAATVINPSVGADQLSGYDPVAHQENVVARFVNLGTDSGVTPNVVYGDQAVSITSAAAGSITDLAAIVPGVQGWIAATGTGTASQDDSLTFASQVRKVALYNASANPVPLEFDQTSSAASFPMPPGAFWVFDNILCTVVHVFPSALLPINTTSGLYVKGWK